MLNTNWGLKLLVHFFQLLNSLDYLLQYVNFCLHIIQFIIIDSKHSQAIVTSLPQ